MADQGSYVLYLSELLLYNYTDGLTFKDVEPEPAQEYLLGNRLNDYALAFAFALVIPLVRWVLTELVFRPTGRYFMPAKYARNPARMGKWIESAWKFVVYSFFTITAFLISYKHVWFYDTRYFWFGCTSFPPCNLHVSTGVLIFYCIQTGFYIQAVHFLTFHEVRRKDWLESMIHHVATAGLLAYSYYVNFCRIGVLIMLLHDISDIFLELAKMCRYCRQQTAALVAFAAFFVSWVVCRMLYFPLVIIRSTLSEPYALVGRYLDVNPMPHYLIFNALLILLLVLHTYWSYLILLVLIKAIKKPSDTSDVREDDDSDSDDDKED